MSEKHRKHISMKPMLSDPIDPGAVVSSSDMTGMFAMMPDAQWGADYLDDLGISNIPVVPEIGDGKISPKKIVE